MALVYAMNWRGNEIGAAVSPSVDAGVIVEWKRRGIVREAEIVAEPLVEANKAFTAAKGKRLHRKAG